MIETMKQLIEDCISMMEYHVEQTRPIHTTTVAIQAAKEALQAIAKAEQQEPVAYRYWNEHNKCFFFCDSPEPVDGSVYEPLYIRPQPKQEQDKIVQVTIKDFVKAVEGKEHLMGRPVYWAQWPNGNTTPQPKQEQDKPDDEVLGFNGWGFPIEPPPNPKQQQGEPVTLEEIRKAMIFGIPLYTHPQPKAEKQEPVGWIDSKGNMLCVKINESCRPLYTHPQPRKPLTDEQIDDLARTMVKGNKSVNWLARAIESARGIKE